MFRAAFWHCQGRLCGKCVLAAHSKKADGPVWKKAPCVRFRSWTFASSFGDDEYLRPRHSCACGSCVRLNDADSSDVFRHPAGCASVTEQYNLVPANGRWCSAVGEVTAGLPESNGSLPPGLWLRSLAADCRGPGSAAKWNYVNIIIKHLMNGIIKRQPVSLWRYTMFQKKSAI